MSTLDPTTGAFTPLHEFEGQRDGSGPGTLIYARQHFFGTTRIGGAAGVGTVFKITP